jgi:hypothetical protein
MESDQRRGDNTADNGPRAYTDMDRQMGPRGQARTHTETVASHAKRDHIEANTRCVPSGRGASKTTNMMALAERATQGEGMGEQEPPQRRTTQST